MKNLFTAKQFAVVIALLSLATVFFQEIATAQTAEEGIANFYSDKFQGRKTASGAVYDKEQTHCIAQNASLRNQGAGDQS